MEQQVSLLKTHPELKAAKEAEFIAVLEKTLDDPETMFLALELIQDPFVSSLAAKKAELVKKTDAISKPSKELASAFGDHEFAENIRLTLLVKKAVESDVISLDELSKSLGLETPGFKAVQRLIMKSIQLNLIKATIDKKTDRVYFL